MVTVDRNKRKPCALSRIVVALCALPASLASTMGRADNAALLYYQAFIRCPELYDAFPSPVIQGVFAGTASAEDVRPHVEKHAEVIQLVELGAHVMPCDWTIPSRQAGSFQRFVVGPVRTITFLIGADVRLLTVQGDYHRALEQALTLRQFAAHLADDPNLGFSLPLLSETNAMQFVVRVLDVAAPDKQDLVWLKDRLAIEPPVSGWLSRSLQADFALTMLHYSNPDVLRSFRQTIPPRTTDAYRNRKTVLATLSDSDLLKEIREPYAKFLDAVLETLTADASYEKMYEHLDGLARALKEKAQGRPEIVFQWQSNADGVTNNLNLLIAQRAQLNALRAAVEVHLVRAKTGRLPEVLPTSAPKDPYSGRDFDYERTPGGFVLRCRARPISEDRIRQFEFTVRNPGGGFEGLPSK